MNFAVHGYSSSRGPRGFSSCSRMIWSLAAAGAMAGAAVGFAPRALASPPATQPAKNIFPKDPNFRPAQVGRCVFVVNDSALLAHSLPALTFKAATLGAVLNRLSDITKTNLVGSWAAMHRQHIRLKKQEYLHLPAQSYRLDLVAALKHFAPHVRMVITAQDNVIFVTTQQQDDETLITRTYYLEDLIDNLPRIIRAGTNLETLHKSARKAATHKPPPHHISTNILQLITNTVRPKIWLNHGGKANISEINNRVTVTAPASVQAILKGPSHYNPNAAPLYLMVNY